MRVTSVIFDRRVVNRTGRIYFPLNYMFFEVLCFQMNHESLIGAIRKAYKFIQCEYGILPDMVFVPFYDYADNQMHTDVTKGDISVTMACEDLGLTMIVLSPDELHGMIGPTMNIDKEI